MPLFRFSALVAAALIISACSDSKESLNETGTTIVTLPGGKDIKAEVVMHPQDMLRGMMFRDKLDMDRGMLFIHGSPGKYPYWMYQVRIPLDILWIGANRSVVEISANTPPCPSKKASECPNFGGHQEAAYVLELAGGAVSKYGIKAGDTINF